MRWFLTLPLILAACVPAPAPQGYGSASYRYAATPSAPSLSVQSAARRAFGYGLPRDDISVVVDGTPMGMRMVAVGGQSFAVFHQYGMPFAVRRHRDLSSQAQFVAQQSTGCAVSGQTFRQTYSNNAFPKYAVHLMC
ncbi:hypothetical protein AB2B41_08355 [Marimonas sp. MJW-29]|uniref:Lipoprotein n=1 Tax=Sulfitobacter sediminis TaxID=3234186 RepID=A0ABV3RKW0_9RHOB